MHSDILSGAIIGGLLGGLGSLIFTLLKKKSGQPGGDMATNENAGPRVYAPPTFGTEIKRVAFGLLWFLVFWIVFRVLAGAIVGGVAGGQAASSHAGQPSGYSSGYDTGYTAGQTASLQFLQRHGLALSLAAFAAAALGTYAGVLPGTRRRLLPPPPAPASEGQWPPPPGGAF